MVPQDWTPSIKHSLHGWGAPEPSFLRALLGRLAPVTLTDRETKAGSGYSRCLGGNPRRPHPS